jgi:hypothetical protein
VLALNIKVNLFMLIFGRMLMQNEYLGKDLSSKDLKPRRMKIRKELGTEGGDFSNSTEPNEDLLEKC